MQRKPLVSLVGILALLMGGCDSIPFFGGNSSSSPSPTSVAASSAAPKSSPISPPRAASSPLSPPTAMASPVNAAKAAPQAPKTTGASPATPGATQSPANIAAAGLLSSSSTDEVLRNNQRGRSDPFALVAVQPLVKAPTGTAQAAATGTAGAARTGAAGAAVTGVAANQRPIPSLPQIPLPPVAAFPAPPAPKAPVTTAAAGGARGTAPAAGGNTPRTGAATGAAGTAAQPFTPQLPALPEPSLARLVEVSGIIDVAGAAPKAIVKAPNENTSRYVSPGERLSDGLILVKRIDMNGPGGPVVILEQFGVEVTRRVGDRPPTTQTGGRPT